MARIPTPDFGVTIGDGWPIDLRRAVLRAVLGQDEALDSEVPYRVKSEDFLDIYYPVRWVEASVGGSIPRIEVQNARTDKNELIPAILLEMSGYVSLAQARSGGRNTK